MGTKRAKVKSGDAIKIGASRFVFIREIVQGKVLVEVEADEHVTILPRFKRPASPVDDDQAVDVSAPAEM